MRPKVMREKPARSGASGSHALTKGEAEHFAIKALRADFQAMPPHKQAERLAHVRQLLIDEALHGRTQPSALARLAPLVFGLRVEDM